MATNLILSDLDRCRTLARSALARAELVLSTRQPGTRGYHDVNAVVEDVREVERMIGRIEAGVVPGGKSPQAQAEQVGRNGATHAADCRCLMCEAARCSRAVAASRSGQTNGKPHNLRPDSPAAHVAEGRITAAVRDCAAHGCAVCGPAVWAADATKAAAGDEPQVVTVAAFGVYDLRPNRHDQGHPQPGEIGVTDRAG